MDAGLGKPCFSTGLHLLWTGLDSLDEKEEGAGFAACMLEGALEDSGIRTETKLTAGN